LVGSVGVEAGISELRFGDTGRLLNPLKFCIESRSAMLGGPGVAMVFFGFAGESFGGGGGGTLLCLCVGSDSKFGGNGGGGGGAGDAAGEFAATA
jgi:hypothetical protein